MFLWLKLGAVGAVVAALLGAYFHYQGLVNERDSLRKQVTQQEMEIAMKDGAITELRESRDRAIKQEQEAIERSEAAQQELVSATRRVDDARQMFADSDFAALLSAKPELLTKMMQRGTDRVFRNIEAEANSLNSTQEAEQ